MGKINLYCTETGALVHVVQEARTDEETVKNFERHYSSFFGKKLFAEIA